MINNVVPLFQIKYTRLPQVVFLGGRGTKIIDNDIDNLVLVAIQT